MGLRAQLDHPMKQYIADALEAERKERNNEDENEEDDEDGEACLHSSRSRVSVSLLPLT